MNTANATSNTTNPTAESLLEEGITAAKAGDKATARAKLQQVTELDQNSEKGWYWLATVVESETERRICLGNVILINPQNERAKQMLEDLSNPLVAARTSTQGLNALLGGIEPRNLKILAAVSVGLLLVLVVLGLGGRSNNASAVLLSNSATPTNTTTLVPTTQPTQLGAQTAIGAAVTAVPGVAVAQNATKFVPPTDPPTWTPVPSLTPVGASLATALAAPPIGLSGHLVAMYGESLTLDNNLPLYLLDPNTKQLTPLTDPDRGDYGVLTPNGEQLIYSRYITGVNEQQFRIINLNGAPFKELSSLWSNKPPLVNHKMISIAANGTGLVFSANNVLENDPDPTIYYLAATFSTAASLNAPTNIPTVDQSSVNPPTDVPPTNVPPTNVPPTDVPSNTPSFTPTVKGAKAPKPTRTPKGKLPTPTPTDIPTQPPPDTPVPPTTDASIAGAPTTPPQQDQQGTLQIVRITPKGSGLNTWPSLSPDGSTIVFVNDKKLTTQGADIYVVPVSGGAPQNLTNDSNANIEAAPQWSPDGTRIVFQAMSQGKTTNDIYVMNANGQNRIALTQGPGDNTRPQWSPDGRYIAFTSTRTGHSEIFILDITSMALYQLTNSATPIICTNWGK